MANLSDDISAALDAALDGPDAEQEEQPGVPLSQQTWAQVWHLPALVLGVLLIGLGVWVSLPTPAKDDFDGALDSVAQFVVASNYEQAADQLEVVSQNIDRATVPQQARYHLLSGDLIYDEQRQKPWLAVPDNLQRIVNSYRKAQELLPPLDGKHLQRLAEAMVAMGRDQEAMQVLGQLRDDVAERRYSIIRQIIDSRMNAPGGDVKDVAALLERFVDELRNETDAAKRRAQRIWATALKARLLQVGGDPSAAGAYLQQAMIRFMDEGGDDDLAPLMVPLALSHQARGQFEDAARWYRAAQQKLEPGDALNAQVLVGLGQVALAGDGDVRSALEHFSAAQTNYPSTPQYLTALMSRADAEARLGLHPEAIEHFGMAVEDLAKNPTRSGDDVDRLTALIESQYELNFDSEKFDLALDYLTVLKPLYGDKMPDQKLALFAGTHERIAQAREKLVADSLKSEAEDPPTDGSDPEAVRRVARQEAAIHYEKAGDYYLQHARAVTIKDDDQFGTSLWNAAMSYDKARRWTKAIDVYSEFVKLRPGDPRRLDAIHRLGLSYQADGQFAPAIAEFAQLIEEHPQTQQAYDSLVPLAQAYIATDRIDDAKRTLLHVVTDHPAITPESAQYREALITLGKLYHRQGEYEAAIERLSEAVERYADTPEAPQLRFLLGDAYRLSIDQLDDSLSKPMPQSKRAALQSERTRRLEQGRILFSQVVAELETRDPAQAGDLEKLYLRNAYFYRADCVYDLGRFEEAINLYDQAARRWESHPASLVALVQIVNAYAELGQVQEAKVANDRARWQLKRIPEDAFNDPTLPMSRQHWQDWLKWTTDLRLFETPPSPQATTAAPTAGNSR